MASSSSFRSVSQADRKMPATQTRKLGTVSGKVERHTMQTTTRKLYTMRSQSPVKLPDARFGARKDAKGVRMSPDPGRLAGSFQEHPKASTWSPMASIVQHSTAPLACCISVPPLASSAPQALQPQPLAQLSPIDQEKAIVDDLLFAFLGFEGQYIRYADSYDPHGEKDRLVGPAYRVLPGLDPAVRDLTMSLLKLATYYVAIEAFVEVQSRAECGTVSHALCAAIRQLLQEYLRLIGQLEHQAVSNPAFSLNILHLHTKPTIHMLAHVYNLALALLKANAILDDDDDDDNADDDDNVDNILEALKDGAPGGPQGKKCKGGNVIGLITRRLTVMAGDPTAKALLTTLLRECSRPYMSMLNEWLHHGSIQDPHAEFLVREQKSIKRERLDEDYTDEYWEKRYTIRDNLIPPQLESVKDKVLLAGKYLNVVRECGGVDVATKVKDVPVTFDDARFIENVNNAYAHANSSLMNLLLTSHALPKRLRSLKHYFFLDRSDFFTHFLDMSAPDLRKPWKEVNVGKLQSLLDLAIRQPGSVTADDPYKEDVKVVMNETSLTAWLMKIVNVTGLEQDAMVDSLPAYTPAPAAASASADSSNSKVNNGYAALVFDYAVPFPLSLVVSRVTLTRYQLLFRHLLSLRYLETLLTGTWSDYCKELCWKRKSKNMRIERAKRRTFTICSRMLMFVQQLLYYSTLEVIEPNWQALMERLTKDVSSETTAGAQKRTVDELMQDHVDFLATCLKECMLTNAKLLKYTDKLISMCDHFAMFAHTMARYVQHAELNAASGDLSRLEKLEEAASKFERTFSQYLRALLNTLNYLGGTETPSFLSLCARLTPAGVGLGK